MVTMRSLPMLLIVVVFSGCTRYVYAREQGPPDLTHLSADELAMIHNACNFDRQIKGPAAYYECLRRQLSALQQSPGPPDLTHLSSDELAMIHNACNFDRQIKGPAAYYECLRSQVAKLGASEGFGSTNEVNRKVIKSVPPELRSPATAASSPRTHSTQARMKQISPPISAPVSRHEVAASAERPSKPESTEAESGWGFVSTLLGALFLAGLMRFAYVRLKRQSRTQTQEEQRGDTQRLDAQGQPSLIERNQDIIARHLDRISAEGKGSYYVENAVRDCLGEIAAREGKQNLVPKYREWLSQWQARSDIPADFRQVQVELLEAFRARHKWLRDEEEREEKKKTELEGQRLIERNADLIQKFLAIAERKVSIVDEYGDENWSALPTEIIVCLRKIGDREGLRFDWDEHLKGRHRDRWFFGLSPEYKWLREQLESRFVEFHERARSKMPNESAVRNLSGEEFETYVATLLRSHGYDVVGTPKTGDQGADLIAKKEGRTIVIQAKRYQGPVGNKAVQEVIAAVQFYGGNEGWVVTNSTFTASAKALAQKGNVRLVDCKALQNRDQPF